MERTNKRLTRNVINLETGQKESIKWVTRPNLATDPGQPGDMAYDDFYMYICVSTNLWKRNGTPLSQWGGSA